MFTNNHTFVVANHIGVHPKAIIHPELISPEDREIIEEKSENDSSPKAWFIRRLSEGIGSIAAAFYPRPVLVRLGDFKVSQVKSVVSHEELSTEPAHLTLILSLTTVK